MYVFLRNWRAGSPQSGAIALASFLGITQVVGSFAAQLTAEVNGSNCGVTSQTREMIKPLTEALRSQDDETCRSCLAALQRDWEASKLTSRGYVKKCVVGGGEVGTCAATAWKAHQMHI